MKEKSSLIRCEKNGEFLGRFNAFSWLAKTGDSESASHLRPFMGETV
jgi:hypothetical protein